MIVLENGDLIEGDATSASEVDFTIYGLDNNALKQLADGQLADAKGTIYTADSTDVVTAIILVNTGAAHNHVNLYFKAATSRRLIPQDLQLEPGYSLHFEGGKVMILNMVGAIIGVGSAGADGADGVAATIAVGTVEAVPSGTPPTVTNVGTPSAAIFDFELETGETGLTGSAGPPGDKGDTGDTGATGASIISAAFVVDNLVFTKDDTNEVTLVDAKIDLKGDTGAPGTGITPLAVGWEATGGTTPKTLTVDKTVSMSDVAEISDIAVDANLSAAAQDAVSKRHTQAHLITSTSDHTPTGLTTSQLLRLNAAGEAIESSGKLITDFEASGVVATHAALTEIHGATGAVVGTTNTQTLASKRITPRITTITTHATPTINTDNCDAVTITALAEPITSMTTNLSGAPVNFQKLIVRIKDNGTLRAIAWGASFVAKGVALPTTTVATKLLTVGFIYDSVATTWGCVASVSEA